MYIILYTLEYTNILVTVGACFLSKKTPLHHNAYCIEHYTEQFTVESLLYLLCIVLSNEIHTASSLFSSREQTTITPRGEVE